MAKKTTSPPPASAPPRPPYMLIEEIRVQGYKSLVDATLHVRPLTLLAGTNSSGKSSIMQPLLLIKQTMEASYNPAGALVLNGAHVQADTAGELVSKIKSNFSGSIFTRITGKEIGNPQGVPDATVYLEIQYSEDNNVFRLERQTLGINGKRWISLTPASVWEEIKNDFSLTKLRKALGKAARSSVIQNVNGFLRLQLFDARNENIFNWWVSSLVEATLSRTLCIPGLRINPSRRYQAAYVQEQVKGPFDNYVAGTIDQWQNQNNTEALTELNDSLRRLGLTDSVTAQVKNANGVELSVSRLPANSKTKPRKSDMVNIADVGIGVSQVLPILVALIAAQEGQIVYVEQPELHLHPKAQVVMAELLADAAKRGVRVIVETHSSLLLLTVQTLVAEGKLTPEQVGLHWFERDAKGATKVTLADVDENGAYGDWPEDFGDVELTAQRLYLDAIGKRRAQRQATKTKAQ